PDDRLALPLYQGGMIHILDPLYNGWQQRQWIQVPADSKRVLPKFLMAESDFHRLSDFSRRWRIGYRPIARTTDTRTMICSLLWPVPCGHSVFLLLLNKPSLGKGLGLSAILGSLSFDSVIRQRLSGTNLSWFIVEECPLPTVGVADDEFVQVVLNA